MKNIRFLILFLFVSANLARAETDLWFDNFESGAGKRWETNTVWKLGSPTVGPAANALGYRAYSGSNCVTTGLTGNAPQNSDIRLICTNYNGSSTLTIPSASYYPRLRFWQWFDFVNSEGYVEINSGSGWNPITTTNKGFGSTANPSGIWSRPSIDLSSYQFQNVQIAFHFTSGGNGYGNDIGWYVDDTALVYGQPVLNNPEGFETGQGDWSVDGGTWSIGSPTAGPDQAHSGTTCAGTAMSGSYGWNVDSRLISPPFTVPTSGNQALFFWEWYKFINALGVVEIKPSGGSWEPITATNLSVGSSSISSGGWTNIGINLSSFAGQTVQVDFHFESGGSGYGTAPGWYIDDVSFPSDISTFNVTAPMLENSTAPGSAPGQFIITRIGGLSTSQTVNFNISGTASNGVNYATLPTSVTFAVNQASTNLFVIPSTNSPTTSFQTVVLTLSTNANYFLAIQSYALINIWPISSLSNAVTAPIGQYWRGSGNDPTYWSQVVPLDSEVGTVYSNMNGNCSTLYPGLTSWNSVTLYHYDATNSLPQNNITDRIAFNNPIVAFGERVGGTPLYVGQTYDFGIYAGDVTPGNHPIAIQVYYRTNYQLAGTITIYHPSPTNTSAWNNYATNGFQLTTNAFGLTTTLSGSPYLAWGATSAGSYALTHTASPLATNYYYVIAVGGNPADNTNAMAVDTNDLVARSWLYSLEFEQRPAWRSTFLDQPHFNGSPLPPFYNGMTLSEMMTNTPAVTNMVNFSPSAALTLDDSPELRRHPVLDNFVASMNNDPIALANYVINQIGLTDPIDYNDDGNVTEDSVNQGGITRGALGTFMEKQGSPMDQCALLVYLLRQAGVPAVYEFAPHNGLQILDTRLSQLLKFQVHGDINGAGQLYTTNTMLPVNYPWVAAYIGTNWVHIFPWLKDYEISEGLNLWDEMPTNYSNAYSWMIDYIYGNTNLLSLAVNGDNTPRVIFPAYLKQMLLKNHPGVSVDDIGVQIVNRQHYYARWEDFPTPTWVTNVSTPLESLSSSTITNINPALTNIFDTMSVEIYSINDPSEDIQTGDLRLTDLHNREFYIDQFTTNGHVQLNLILMPFRTNITTQFSFTNDTDLLSKEMLTLPLNVYDNQLGVRFKYHRHRAITPAYPIGGQVFLGLSGYNEIDFERPLGVGDQAAICLNYGQVSTEMLNADAQSLWQMEGSVEANHTLTNSVSPDVYEGAIMYLAGMSYFEKCGEFDGLNQQLQKYEQLSIFSAGLSKIIPGRNSSGSLTNGADPVLPCVDMFFYTTMVAGTGLIHPDFEDNTIPENNFALMQITDSSAEEHQVINRFYQQTNAVSTVRLLQLSQMSGASIVPMTPNNFIAQGQTYYQGQQLQNWDSGIWQEITNAFQADSSNDVTAYMTPGPISNGAYKGMGALIINFPVYSALISPESLNGGFAGTALPADTITPANTPNYDVSDNNGDYSAALVQPASGTTTTPDQTASFDAAATASQISNGDYVNTPVNDDSAINTSQLLGTQSGTSDSAVAQATLVSEQQGNLSTPNDAGAQTGTQVSDPVNNITGEFYVQETDLQLPGPIPLALHRNYSSQNLADNQFGYGWKLSIMPYLSLSKGSTNIYAADMDGAVLAYVRSLTNSSLWSPTLAANPHLDNNTTAGVGELANRLHDYILSSVSGSTTNYTLYGVDGSVRLFQFMNFNSGTITNDRPYLLQWTDNRGNYYNFTYDTNPADANFGQMDKVQCSNGNYFNFDYDIYGHMIDAYTGDGRWTYYQYDNYGDLVTITLPDNSIRSYQYLHSTQAVTNSGVVTQQPYSTHLIIEEDKPDGRELINAYDSQRRVTNQLSTAGIDLNPIPTATFVYSNNFNLTNSYTNTISGYTLVVDGNNHTNRYDYTNDLVTKITNPLGQTIQQTWYTDTATAPGYPRSIQQRIDKRGLITQYQYGLNGNVTNLITIGDLTGDGIATQSATNAMAYNPNNVPRLTVDPLGNSMVTIYDPVFTFLPQQVIYYAGAIPVTTNFTFYGNVTNIVVNGSVTRTNIAFGLPVRQIRAYGSPDAVTNDTVYNGNGFPIQTIRYTGTGDPNVTNTYFYNERGEMVDQVDALGAIAYSEFDALNRPIEKENIDEFGNTLSLIYYYYTENGEISWVDGPRYNPDNYTFYDYDGAGRPTTEIHWRSEANSSGTGVEAPAGYNLYAQTFNQYDPLGNLLLQVDPRGAMTTNSYNALCELVQTKHLDTNGTTVLSTDGYGYEPGGQVQSHTNALGGVTTTLFTIAGKPEYCSNPDGSTNGWRYYLDGRPYRKIQSNGAYWQTTYDDVNRITTQVFYSAFGIPEATNSTQLDRRGNVIQKVDANGNVFATTFDGLDRAKTGSGPAIVTVSTVSTGMMPTLGPPTYVTNVLQQAITNFYDAANRVLTSFDALGESTVSRYDALHRPVSSQIYSASGTLVRESYTGYSADHNSVTTTNGSGATAIINTVYTDTDGHTVLSLAYPSPGILDYVWQDYDLAGNMDYAEHDTSTGGSITNWTFAGFTHDGLNRTTSETNRDNAVTTYAYDALNDPTNRTIPGGLQWQAAYNQAGQILQELISGGGQNTRSNAYAYYPAGNAFAGLLDTLTDGRGLVSTYNYDDQLRKISAVQGDPRYTSLNTYWNYEARGYVTNISEQYTGGGSPPPTSVQRSFDPYGQLAYESISINGTNVSSAGQSWDVAGHRTGLGINGEQYNFDWRADGALVYVGQPAGNGSYTFDTAGLLTGRVVGNRSTTITARDGEGRPDTTVTTINGATALTETQSRNPDGTLANDLLYRADFTDARSYAYDSLSRRLAQEQLNLNGSTTWTNPLTYDGGVSAGPGILTQIGQGAAVWSGGVSPFARVNTETNTSIRYSAYGRLNGVAALTAYLDGQPLAVTTNSSGATNYPYQWHTVMELTPGAHQLKVAALHPSGFYTAWATNVFTNSLANQSMIILRDNNGNITQRIWRNPDGSTNRMASFDWDARNRLSDENEMDNVGNGYYLRFVYDGLNRRLLTQCYPIVNNGFNTAQPPQVAINQYYDPMVEFLELGMSYGDKTEWKLYGPDLNGTYGGENGTGGFDAVSPGLNQFNPVISDSRGDILAEVTNGVAAWTAARPTGYGAVPGYRPVALGYGADVAQSSAWRGRWVDVTGNYQIGMRQYDPVAGMWLSYDSMWNERDPNYLTFAGGDPINSFDSDGRGPNDQYVDPELQADLQYEIRQGSPAAVQAMQQEGDAAYYNGDGAALLQGQNERAAETAAVVLPTMGVASVISLPAGPEGEAITWNVIGGAIVRSGFINAAASGTVAYETGQPVLPAAGGGFIAGAITGPAGAYAQTISPVASVFVNSTAGFAGNYAGNASSQVYQNGGLNNYDPNQSLFAGILGATMNPAEANISASAEDAFPATVTQTSLFGAGQVSLEYGIGVGDSAFGASLDPASNDSQASPSLNGSLDSPSQQSGEAYTPGPLGGKY